ncbi:MAG: prepilin-type N-terminal cleavage/methylation domain-containing protein [Elusimicrobiaceae bacterium]|nr:prepilin-type N-terminal cleavage/methylation domain-containing protein [Elusimicrobiaceae bacterium]MBP5616742.1 prepilin-type N-terminal cleavage/methylation domain-containing protein [Elusimicrobiaceae bacterium]
MYKRGFTLVEILFVVIIAAGLLAIAAPSYKKAQERSQYTRAVGYLTSIGAAIVSLQKDYTMLSPDSFSASRPTGSTNKIAIYWTFPANNKYWKFTGSWAVNYNSQLGTQSITDWLYKDRGVAVDMRDKRFEYALYKGKYLKNFTNNTGYSLYGIRDDSPGACSGFCKTGGNNPTVACMCKDTYDANDCYYGAKYLLDGTVRRLKGANCK